MAFTDALSKLFSDDRFIRLLGLGAGAMSNNPGLSQLLSGMSDSFNVEKYKNLDSPIAELLSKVSANSLNNLEKLFIGTPGTEQKTQQPTSSISLVPVPREPLRLMDDDDEYDKKRKMTSKLMSMNLFGGY